MIKKFVIKWLSTQGVDLLCDIMIKVFERNGITSTEKKVIKAIEAIKAAF